MTLVPHLYHLTSMERQDNGAIFQPEADRAKGSTMVMSNAPLEIEKISRVVKNSLRDLKNPAFLFLILELLRHLWKKH